MLECLVANFEALDGFVRGLACSEDSCRVAARELVDQNVTAALFEVRSGADTAFAVRCLTKNQRDLSC